MLAATFAASIDDSWSTLGTTAVVDTPVAGTLASFQGELSGAGRREIYNQIDTPVPFELHTLGDKITYSFDFQVVDFDADAAGLQTTPVRNNQDDALIFGMGRLDETGVVGRLDFGVKTDANTRQLRWDDVFRPNSFVSQGQNTLVGTSHPDLGGVVDTVAVHSVQLSVELTGEETVTAAMSWSNGSTVTLTNSATVADPYFVAGVDTIAVGVNSNLVDWVIQFTNVQIEATLTERGPHPDDAGKLAEDEAVFALVSHEQATHSTVQSGDWSDPSSWLAGAVPDTGARVLIAAGHQLTVDGVLDQVALKTLRVDGALEFSTSVDTLLRVETLVVGIGGVVEMGTAANPIDANVTARIRVVPLGPLDPLADPFQIGRGVISHGTWTMHGALKTGAHVLAAPALAGSDVLQFSTVPADWRVGDQLVVAGTDPTAATDETRFITAIGSTAVTVGEPLNSDHQAPQVDLPVHVINTTRNAVIESEQFENLEDRGHVMLMHNRNVDIAYAGFYELGRTDKLVRLNKAVLTPDGQVEPGTGTNQPGRYSVHFHRNGIDANSAPAVIHGSAVVGNPGLGYVVHSSYVVMTDNVAHDVVGSAFFSEVGDEIGVMDGNVSIRTTGGSGDGRYSRQDVADVGHEGDGFWLQGAGIYVRNNVATDARGSGFIYYTKAFPLPDGSEPRFLSANLPDPSIAGGNDTMQIQSVPIFEFRNNVAYGSAAGFRVELHQRPSQHGVDSVLEDSLFYNNQIGGEIRYARHVTLKDVRVIGDLDSPLEMGVGVNNSTGDVTYDNLHVVGYTTGMEVPRRGVNLIDGGFFNNVENILLSTKHRRSEREVLIRNIQFGALSAAALNGRAQLQIRTQGHFDPENRNAQSVFLADRIILEFGQFNGEQLFFHEQHADFVPYALAGTYVSASQAGLTNAELWAQFGLAVGGAIAPGDAFTVQGIVGLLGPL